jgi:ribosomal protein S18 acetylase RimI-like enzyme
MRYVALACRHQVPDIVRLYHFLVKDYQDDPAAVEAALSHPATCVYYAYDCGKVVGSATLSTRAVPCFGLVGYIDDVVVDPAYRGRGHARALMEHCLAAARARDCQRVQLSSSPHRKAARRLYQKLGFVKHKTDTYLLEL